MDFGTIGGIVFAIGMILVGQALEGGHVGSLLQLTAGMIVLGGTFGAVMVSFPMNEFVRGLKMAANTIKQKKSDLQQILDQIVDLAGVARRDGVLALEQRLPELKDPFLKRAVGFIVDGVDATVARDSLETEIVREFEEGTVGAKVFASASWVQCWVLSTSWRISTIHPSSVVASPRLSWPLSTASAVPI